MTKLLFSSLLALVLIEAVPVALAQDKIDRQTVQELKKVDPVPPATGKTVPEQAGTQEPSSKVQGTSKDGDVLVNGVLTAPGAQTDVDTAPAKYSARTAADDQVSIAGYRLRRLTDEQRREIAQQLGKAQPGKQRYTPASGDAASADHAVVGALVPAAVALTALTPVPEAMAAKFPELRGAGFMRAGGKLILVDLDNTLVIGVLEG
jgi:hypothetical protein